VIDAHRYSCPLLNEGRQDASSKLRLLHRTMLAAGYVRDQVDLEHLTAQNKITSREKMRHMETLAAADVDTIALAALIATAEASGVEPGEVSKARILLARAKAAQEVKRHREEIAALESLRLATAPEVSAISRAQLEAVLAACRACNAPAHEVEAGQARLVQVIKWQKLSAALAPNAEGGWDLATLREALEEATAAGLPPLPEAQATLLRAEEVAKERVVRQKMKREAEKNLNAAMPSMFGMNKTDAAKLGKAVEIARKAGVDDRLIAAAELKLQPMRAEAEAKAKAEADKLAYEERMRPILEAARREAEERTNADAEARMVASAYEAARREAEDRVRIAGQAEATAAMTEAEALRMQEAGNELRLAAGVSLGMLDLPRLMRAVDAADEAGVDLEQIRAAQKTLATAQRRAAAKEGLVAALAPSVEELTSSDAALFRLREAATEAEAVGLPSLAAAQQKLAAADKVLAQKEELGRREAGRREEQDRARREAETELKAAMPGMLTSAEPHRLQAAVDAAKVAGVSPAEIRAAEAKLSALWTKEAVSGEKARLAAEAAHEAKLAHYEKELKAAAGLGGWGFGSQEVTDVLRLEAAIEAARGAGITSEVLGKAEAKLAAIRIDAEKKRSFELTNPDAAAQELRKSFEKQNASRNASFENQKQSFEKDNLPPLPASARSAPPLPEADSFSQAAAKGPPPAPPKRTAPPSMASRSTGSFSKAFSSVSKGVMGIGSKPLPFAPNAPGMAEKLEGQRGGGFSAVRGSGPGGGGAQASAGPKKIKASSAPLKFAPGAPTAGGKGPVRMQRRTSTEPSDN